MPQMDIDQAMEVLKQVDVEYQFTEPYSEAVRVVDAELDRLYAEIRQLKGGKKGAA